MEKMVSPKKDISDLDETEKNKDRERIAPSRKYSVLEEDERKNFIENGQKIETF